LGLIGKLQCCGIPLPTDSIEGSKALADAWSAGAPVSALEVLTTFSLASIQATRIQMDAVWRLAARSMPSPGKPPEEDADKSLQAGATSVKPSGDEPPQPGPAAPQSLDRRAVGFAHEMLAKGKGINVAEVARWLGCERTKLYVFLRASATKNRRPAEQPIPHALARDLRAWLRNTVPEMPVFPLHHETAKRSAPT
jgi:hypothetical protein